MKTIAKVLTILPYCSSGQGLYLPRNQSATSIQAAYTSTQAAVSMQGIEIGHSIGGIVDVGWHVGRDRLDSYYNTSFYGFSTSLLLLNPKEINGAILSIDAAYTRMSIKSANYTYDQLNTGEYVIGGTAGVRFANSPILNLLPSFNVGVSTKSNQLETESNLFYGFELLWVYQTGSLTRFVFTPSVSISNDISTFGLKGGFVFLQ
jgi:hypothetical protein